MYDGDPCTPVLQPEHNRPNEVHITKYIATNIVIPLGDVDSLVDIDGISTTLIVLLS
jgi:hypothetical protein